MVFWKYSRVSLVHLVSVVGILILVFLALAQIEQPQMLALKNASMHVTNPIVGVDKVSSSMADGLHVATAIDHSALRFTKPIPLPFFEVRQQSHGLQKIVYSIDLSHEILQQHSPRREAGSLEVDDKYAVLFPQVLNGGEFYFNESWVAGLSASSDRERWAWHKPFVVPLPSHLIRKDGRLNILTISQTSQAPYISITRPYIGTAKELHRVSEVLAFFGATLAASINVLCLAAGIFLLCVSVACPEEPVYVMAGLASALWAVLFMLIRWEQIDMALYGVWRWTIYALQSGLICLVTMFFLSIAGKPLGKRGRNFFFSITCLGPIAFSIGGWPAVPYINMLLTPMLLMFYVYACLRLVQYCFRVRDMSAFGFLASSAVSLALAIHDHMILTGLIRVFESQNSNLAWPKLLFDNFYLSHLGAPLLLGLVGNILLKQHKSSIAAIASRDSFLESSILEYESNYEEICRQLDLISRSEAAAIERERIYQDIHDGIGSQLVKAIFTLHSCGPGLAGVKYTLQECLVDLRNVINANYESAADIQSAVFAFCQAQEAHLEGSGLTISYDVGVESTTYSDPKINLNVLRIIQEALTNTIKHSGASEIFVEVKTSNSDLLLFITDQGRNLSISRSDRQDLLYGRSNQKGVGNIARRAATVGGKYAVNITQSGTQVRLAIPLPKTL